MAKKATIESPEAGGSINQHFYNFKLTKLMLKYERNFDGEIVEVKGRLPDGHILAILIKQSYQVGTLIPGRCTHTW